MSRPHKGGQNQLPLWRATQCHGWWLPSGQSPGHVGKDKKGKGRKEPPPPSHLGPQLSLCTYTLLPFQPTHTHIIHPICARFLPHSVPNNFRRALLLSPFHREENRSLESFMIQGCAIGGAGIPTEAFLALKSLKIFLQWGF